MRKALRKHILTLCILLLNSYGFTYANSSQDLILHSPPKNSENSHFANFCPVQNCQYQQTKFAASGSKENVNFDSEEREEENNKLLFLNSYIGIGNYFTAFYTQSSKRQFCEIKKPLPFLEHWFYSSSRRYVILQVMRI